MAVAARSRAIHSNLGERANYGPLPHSLDMLETGAMAALTLNVEVGGELNRIVAGSRRARDVSLSGHCVTGEAFRPLRGAGIQRGMRARVSRGDPGRLIISMTISAGCLLRGGVVVAQESARCGGRGVEWLAVTEDNVIAGTRAGGDRH
jgi:hypothetical protein